MTGKNECPNNQLAAELSSLLIPQSEVIPYLPTVFFLRAKHSSIRFTDTKLLLPCAATFLDKLLTYLSSAQHFQRGPLLFQSGCRLINHFPSFSSSGHPLLSIGSIYKHRKITHRFFTSPSTQSKNDGKLSTLPTSLNQPVGTTQILPPSHSFLPPPTI